MPMRSNKGLSIMAAVLAVVGLNAAAWSQEEADKPAKVWQKKPNFSIRLGSIFSDVSNQFRIDGADGEGTLIDAQDVLKLPKSGTALRAKGDVRVAKWFGMDYYFWKSLGVGVTYEYIKSSMERNSAEFVGMVSNRSSSIQVYLAVGF